MVSSEKSEISTINYYMKLYLYIFLILITQHQFALANMCEITLDQEKQRHMLIDREIFDTNLFTPKKIEFTSRCIESQQYNTKCKDKSLSKDQYIFDKDGRAITKNSSIGPTEHERNEYKYNGNAKYPFEITDKFGKTIKIERNSEDLPIKITSDTIELIEWDRINGYWRVDYAPKITNFSTFPGIIKFYKDNILIKAKFYNKTSTSNIICRRYEDKDWNDITDEIIEDGDTSKLRHRTARHKNGYVVFTLFNAEMQGGSKLFGTSYRYKSFDENVNWTSREVCHHRSSWDISESCTEELRSIEYKSFPKK